MENSKKGKITCPFCGSVSLETRARAATISVYGREAQVRGLSQMICQDCGDDFETGEQEVRNSSVLMRARDRLSLITPSMIRELRVKYDLSQSAAGKLFGGGEKAFAKYEAGTVAPTEAAAKLLRLVLESESAFRDLTNIADPRFASSSERMHLAKSFDDGVWVARALEEKKSSERHKSKAECRVYYFAQFREAKLSSSNQIQQKVRAGGSRVERSSTKIERYGREVELQLYEIEAIA